MANLVERATNDMLSGPDWAMNMELCDLINSEPGHAKDAVKVVKKRLGNKNPKVQLLALTVLETIVKNCGDYVHHQVAAKDVLHEMVKMAKKNKDSRVREKVLLLLDSWQEAFGGPGGRYPQYFMAYDELRRLGVMFPQREETVPPIYTPPQSHPIASNFPSPPRSPTRMHSVMEASRQSDLPGLSLTDMQTARSVMEVLAEMLSAVDPRNKTSVRDEVIVELVEQCHTAEQRVMQLVNSTSDEELLRQGLSLNDDLKKVLARHHALLSGVSLPPAAEPPSAPPFLIDHQRESSNQSLAQVLSRGPQASSAVNKVQLALPAPAQQHKPAPPAIPAPTIDLLSGDALQETTPPPVHPINTASVPSLLPTLSQQGTTSLSSNGAGFQSVAMQPVYGNPQQSEANFMHSNGGMLPGQQFRVSSQPNSFNQGPQAAQSFGNTYVAPWAQPGGAPSSPQQAALVYGTSQASGPSLSPQQQALIYGSEQNALSLSSHQQALIYGVDQSASLQRPHLTLPSTSQQTPIFPPPALTQVYGSHLQLPQQQVYDAQQQQSLNVSPYAYGSSVSGPSHPEGLGFSSPRTPTSHLPPAPWSTENTESESFAQPNSYLYGPTMLAGTPQTLEQAHFFHQQRLLAANQFPQAGLAGQMQNLSLQGGVYQPPTMQAGVPPMYFQRPGAMRAESKPEDKLFKDLVDLAKPNKGGSSSK